MNHIDLLLYWVTLACEVVLCVLVYVRKAQRELPVFTAYSTLFLAGTLVIGFAYEQFGYRSTTSYYIVWIVIGLNLTARCLVVVELCRYKLRAYKGIWALAWRILIGLAVLFLGHAAIDAWGQPDRVAIYGLTVERDVAITSVVILIAILFIRKYYGLFLEPLQKWVAVGILLLCTVDVFNNTVLHDLFMGNLFSWFSDRHAFLWPAIQSQIEGANEIWNMIRGSSFILSLGIWSYALRKPLPAAVRDPVLLPREVYRQLSPAVNLHLRAFNDRLLELLKP